MDCFVALGQTYLEKLTRRDPGVPGKPELSEGGEKRGEGRREGGRACVGGGDY